MTGDLPLVGPDPRGRRRMPAPLLLAPARAERTFRAVRPFVPFLALLCCAGGVILVLEVVRPFRDLRRDGPIGLGLWIAGLVLAGVGLWAGWGRGWLNIVALVANALCLVFTVLAMIALSRIRRFF